MCVHHFDYVGLFLRARKENGSEEEEELLPTALFSVLWCGTGEKEKEKCVRWASVRAPAVHIRKQRTRLFRRGTQQQQQPRRRQLVVQPGPLGS